MGEEWPLLFTRGEGFRLDPKAEETQEDLEQRVLELGSDGEWRTYRDYATELGVRQKRAREMLEALVEAERVETVIGPPGRSARARCYRTAPEAWAHSGSVEQLGAEPGNCATAPDVYRDTSVVGAVDGSRSVVGSVPGAVGSLIDANGRCVRHPDEPRAWCLECKASAA